MQTEVRTQHLPEHFLLSRPPNRGSVSDSTRLVTFSDVFIMAAVTVRVSTFTGDILTL